MYPIAVSTALLSWGLLEFPKVSGRLLLFPGLTCCTTTQCWTAALYRGHFCMVTNRFVCQTEVSNVWF